MRRHSLVWLVFLAIFVGLLASPLLFQEVQGGTIWYKIEVYSDWEKFIEIKDIKFYTSEDCSGTPLVLAPPLAIIEAGCGSFNSRSTSVSQAAKSVAYRVMVWYAHLEDGDCIKDLEKEGYPQQICGRIKRGTHRAKYCGNEVEVLGPVGGTAIQIDKLSLLAPYIALATVVVAVTVGAAYVKKGWLGKTVVQTP